MMPRPPRPTRFPYPTLFGSGAGEVGVLATQAAAGGSRAAGVAGPDRVEVAARGQAGSAPDEGGAAGVGLDDLPWGTGAEDPELVQRAGASRGDGGQRDRRACLLRRGRRGGLGDRRARWRAGRVGGSGEVRVLAPQAAAASWAARVARPDCVEVVTDRKSRRAPGERCTGRVSLRSEERRVGKE